MESKSIDQKIGIRAQKCIDRSYLEAVVVGVILSCSSRKHGCDQSRMASRAFFLSLRRARFVEGRRFLSSGGLGSELVEDAVVVEGSDDLKSRIFRLRLPKRSVTNVIQKWVGEGNETSASELRQISKELRKSQRYKHALEVSEWMVTNEGYELSDKDYADRIDLMTKVFGVDAAERYFEGLPTSAKTSETYTALLHSYASLKMSDKAADLYEKIKDLNLSFSALTYNEMMTLYMSIGQVEKVSSVVDEMKRLKVALDIFTYNLWISSYAAMLRIDEVERVLDEMSQDSNSNENWKRYRQLTRIYVISAQLLNSESGGLVEAEKGITQREWITYDFLVILHASLGKKERVDQIWKSLRMTKQKMTSRNFLCVLSSYLMLGHMKEVGEVIDQWKQATITSFDSSYCSQLLDAYREIGLIDTANAFHVLLIEKNCISGDEP
ncbi:hypothetical protein BT93_D1101 [Corymbia citriodora subsp. variegata]|nr:hypothetical protein BT93_D1101 [Corymbia citriodora subsp. variegata]